MNCSYLKTDAIDHVFTIGDVGTASILSTTIDVQKINQILCRGMVRHAPTKHIFESPERFLKNYSKITPLITALKSPSLMLWGGGFRGRRL
jgi:hypothetical protein